MSTPEPSGIPLPTSSELAEADVKGCCAAVYAHPAVRWLLGDELHPGGERTTLRALELAGVVRGGRLLDVASGNGASALLAARELGCEVMGVEYGEPTVAAANAAAAEAGLEARVSFRQGDAEALPFAAREFDAVLCECSLCTFPDKRTAVAEARRVLRPGGRVALSDVVVNEEALPAALRGPLATLACVGAALPEQAYVDLLAGAGLRVTAVERRDDATAALVQRVEDRLRGGHLLGVDGMLPPGMATTEAIELVGLARTAIDDGVLGYAIFAAQA